jgi:hypothetical protein
VDGGLVRIEHVRGVAMGDCAVVLTAAGREALREAPSIRGQAT